MHVAALHLILQGHHAIKQWVMHQGAFLQPCMGAALTALSHLHVMRVSADPYKGMVDACNDACSQIDLTLSWPLMQGVWKVCRRKKMVL